MISSFFFSGLQLVTVVNRKNACQATAADYISRGLGWQHILSDCAARSRLWDSRCIYQRSTFGESDFFINMYTYVAVITTRAQST